MLPLPNRFGGLDIEEKKQLVAGVKDVFQQVAQQVAAGEFPAAPQDTQLCGGCQWKKLCRAPHLR